MSNNTLALDSVAYRTAIDTLAGRVASIDKRSKTMAAEAVTAICAVWAAVPAGADDDKVKAVRRDLRTTIGAAAGSWAVWSRQASLLSAIGITEPTAADITAARKVMQDKVTGHVIDAAASGMAPRDALRSRPVEPAPVEPAQSAQTSDVPDTNPIPAQRTATVTVSEVDRVAHVKRTAELLVSALAAASSAILTAEQRAAISATASETADVLATYAAEMAALADA